VSVTQGNDTDTPSEITSGNTTSGGGLFDEGLTVGGTSAFGDYDARADAEAG
jgi:hypothetical protein